MVKVRFQFSKRVDDNVLKEIKWNEVGEKKLNENITKRIFRVNCLAKTATTNRRVKYFESSLTYKFFFINYHLITKKVDVLVYTRSI